MAHQINNIYTFDDEHETLLNLSTHNNPNPNPNPITPVNPNNSDQNLDQNNQTNLQPPYW